MTDALEIKATSTILDLLKSGGSITLANGVTLTGNLKSLFIEVTYKDEEGELIKHSLRNLTPGGLGAALMEAKVIESDGAFCCEE